MKSDKTSFGGQLPNLLSYIMIALYLLPIWIIPLNANGEFLALASLSLQNFSMYIGAEWKIWSHRTDLS